MGFRQMTYFSVIKEPLERLFFHYDFKSMETLFFKSNKDKIQAILLHLQSLGSIKYCRMPVNKKAL